MAVRADGTKIAHGIDVALSLDRAERAQVVHVNEVAAEFAIPLFER
ncbi:MAG TPA: hypothetical protein VF221_04525 [Chloroflexota bacterium]